MKDPRRRPINELERIEQNIVDLAARLDISRCPIEAWQYRLGRHLAPGQYQFDSPWKPYDPSLPWGGPDVTAWFRTTLTIPPSMAGQDVLLRLYPGGEAILRLNGVPVGGLDIPVSRGLE